VEEYKAWEAGHGKARAARRAKSRAGTPARAACSTGLQVPPLLPVALSINPSLWPCLFLLGCIYYSLGRHSSSVPSPQAAPPHVLKAADKARGLAELRSTSLCSAPQLLRATAAAPLPSTCSAHAPHPSLPRSPASQARGLAELRSPLEAVVTNEAAEPMERLAAFLSYVKLEENSGDTARVQVVKGGKGLSRARCSEGVNEALRPGTRGCSLNACSGGRALEAAGKRCLRASGEGIA
jgi:hypothetical protein